MTFPSEWSNDAQMSFYMTSLSRGDEHAKNAKLQFWMKVLMLRYESDNNDSKEGRSIKMEMPTKITNPTPRNLLTFTTSQLLHEYSRAGIVPRVFEEVIQVGIESGEILTVEEVERRTVEKNRKSNQFDQDSKGITVRILQNTTSIVWNAWKVGASLMKLTSKSPITSTQKLVLVDSLASAANALLAQLDANQIYPISKISDLYGNQFQSPEDLILCVNWLCANSQISEVLPAGSSESSSTDRKSCRIFKIGHDSISVLDYERGLIMNSIRELTQRQELYLTQIDQLQAEARAIFKKDKQKAIQILSLKKRIQKQYESSSIQILNLQTVLQSMEQTIEQKLVFSVLAKSQKALKHAQQDLDANDVEVLYEDLQENLIEEEEITELMSKPIKEDQFNDDDLLAELSLEVESQTQTVSSTSQPKTTITEPVKPAKSDPDELKELEQELEALSLGTASSITVPTPRITTEKKALELA